MKKNGLILVAWLGLLCSPFVFAAQKSWNPWVVEVRTEALAQGISATTFDIIAQQNRSQTDVFGIGIKQMLVGRGARIIPVISAGYARQFVTSSGDITIENTTTSGIERVNLNESKQRYNSVFGSFTLQLKLTESFSLKGTVRTLFPAFEFNKAKDNLKYLIGFSWVF